MHRALACWTILSLSLGLAQARELTPDVKGTAASVAARAVGLAETAAGELRGFGPGYEVRFDSGSFEFLPALGPTAPRVQPLRFELEQVGRGAQALALDLRAAPTFQDLGVRYARGAGVTERYDLRPEGMEQSFLFEQPLSGDGDLVVRGRLSTELELRPSTSGGLDLYLAERPVVRIGGVTGIDAAGRRAAGWMRCRGDELELGLPAEFVAAASWPLVLDPLIGTVDVVTSAAAPGRRPALAYDDVRDEYLIAWEEVFAANVILLHGHRVDANGEPVGSGINFNVPWGINEDLTLTVDSLCSYLAYEHRDDPADDADVLVTVVEGDFVHGSVPIASTPDEEHSPSLASANGALIAWVSEDRGIYVRGLDFASGLELTPALHVTQDPTAARPDLDGGVDIGVSRYLLVWMQLAGTTRDVQGRLVDGDAQPVGDVFPLADQVHVDEANPAVASDGNGLRFVAVWDQADDGGTAGKDLFARAVTFEPTVPGSSVKLAPAEAVANDPLLDERLAEVAFTGNQYVVVFQQESSGPTRIGVRAVDPYSCLPCEGAFLVPGGEVEQRLPVIAGNRASATYNFGAGSAVIAFAQGAGEIPVEAWRDAEIGNVFEFGSGACGGIQGTVVCAKSGNSAFTLRLDGAPQGGVAFALLAAPNDVLGLSCSTGCSVVPHPWKSFLLPATTPNAFGECSFNLALPPGISGAAKNFILQWAVIHGSAPCPELGVLLSEAVDVTIDGSPAIPFD
jgi:hypothetical protein